MDGTESPDEALVFRTSIGAITFYFDHPFGAAQLVLQFGDLRFDVVLPVEGCKPSWSGALELQPQGIWIAWEVGCPKMRVNE